MELSEIPYYSFLDPINNIDASMHMCVAKLHYW